MRNLLDALRGRRINLHHMLAGARMNEHRARDAFYSDPSEDNYTWLAQARTDVSALLAQVTA